MTIYNIVFSHLNSIPGCDAKNMAQLIVQYTEFTDLEKIFNRSLLQRSITRVMSSHFCFSEYQIIEMIENPSAYRSYRGIELCILLFLKYASYSSSFVIDLFIEPMAHYLKDYSRVDILILFDKDSRLEILNDIEYNIIQYLIWMVYLNVDTGLIIKHFDSSARLTNRDLTSFYNMISNHLNYLKHALD
jgi:hypothetical protein